MKLPRVEYRGVETVGRHDLGAVSEAASVAAQRGRAIQQVSNQIAGVIDDYRERKENAEYNEVLATMKSEVMNWESEYDVKQTYTADDLGDISEDLVPRMETGTDPVTGDTFSTIRGNIPAHEVYPHLKQKFLNGLVEQQANKISNVHMRKQFMTTAKPFVADKMMRAVIVAEQAQQAYVQSQYEEQAQKAAEAQDLDSAYFAIDQMEGKSDVEKRELKKVVDGISESAFYIDAIRSPDQETILIARGMLEDPSYDGALTEPQRQAAIKDLNARFLQLDAEAKVDKANRHGELLNNMSVGIVDGLVSRMDLDNFYAKWKADDTDPESLKPAEHAALVKQLVASQKAQLKVADYEQIVAGWRDNSIPADPSNKDHRDAMEWYVKTQGITEENVNSLGILVAGTGIMPETLKIMINGYMLNGDVKQGAASLTMYQTLKAKAPHLLTPLSSDTTKIGEMASLLNRGGFPPEQAIEKAREYLADVTPERETYYKDAYREGEFDNLDALEDLMDADDSFDVSIGPSRDVDPPPSMIAEFDAMVNQLYPLAKGDIGRARTMAYEAIQRNWGITGVGGEMRAVKHPPERMLQASSKSVEDGMKLYARGMDINYEHMRLGSDSLTVKDHSWQVFIMDPETGSTTKMESRWNRSYMADAYTPAWEADMIAAEIEKLKNEQQVLEGQLTVP